MMIDNTITVLSRLNKHNHIAYDLDGTLFGIYGKALAQYIVDNPNKTHSIITSRQSVCISASITQLRQLFGDIHELPFKHIIHSPSATLEGHQVRPNFKGEECKRIGATALVDDWQVHSIGCVSNCIEFVFIHGLY